MGEDQNRFGGGNRQPPLLCLVEPPPEVGREFKIVQAIDVEGHIIEQQGPGSPAQEGNSGSFECPLHPLGIQPAIVIPDDGHLTMTGARFRQNRRHLLGRHRLPAEDPVNDVVPEPDDDQVGFLGGDPPDHLLELQDRKSVV